MFDSELPGPLRRFSMPELEEDFAPKEVTGATLAPPSNGVGGPAMRLGGFQFPAGGLDASQEELGVLPAGWPNGETLAYPGLALRRSDGANLEVTGRAGEVQLGPIAWRQLLRYRFFRGLAA